MDCVYYFVLPLNRENMGVIVHVRELTKWARARRGRRDCARSCKQQTEEASRFGPGPEDPARHPSCRRRN